MLCGVVYHLLQSREEKQQNVLCILLPCYALLDPLACVPIYLSMICFNKPRWVFKKKTFANLTDMTLHDEDTNSILTDNANRAIQGYEAMQLTQPGGKICN